MLAGEVVDATFMSRDQLVAFLQAEIAEAKRQDVLFSIHLKATMMKVSDPIIFGHAVRAYFADVFDRYGDDLEAAGADPNNGLGQVLATVDQMEDPRRSEIAAAFARGLETGPDMAMVDSDRGITNLHVPSDVIIDASMPAMIRTSGQMWNAEGHQQDTKAIIPDSSYAGVYQETIDFCRRNGAFDPTTMGTVPKRRAHGPERPRSTAPTTRRSRYRPTAPCASSTATTLSCSSTGWPGVTSGGCARSRTPRSRTG